jgi:hypothetical protein
VPIGNEDTQAQVTETARITPYMVESNNALTLDHIKRQGELPTATDW